MINLSKEFKKGEYYKSYMMLLNVRYDFDKKQWIYNTYIKKEVKEAWIKNKCDDNIIAPFVQELIQQCLTDLKLSDVVEEQDDAMKYINAE